MAKNSIISLIVLGAFLVGLFSCNSYLGYNLTIDENPYKVEKRVTGKEFIDASLVKEHTYDLSILKLRLTGSYEEKIKATESYNQYKNKKYSKYPVEIDYLLGYPTGMCIFYPFFLACGLPVGVGYAISHSDWREICGFPPFDFVVKLAGDPGFHYAEGQYKKAYATYPPGYLANLSNNFLTEPFLWLVKAPSVGGGMKEIWQKEPYSDKLEERQYESRVDENIIGTEVRLLIDDGQKLLSKRTNDEGLVEFNLREGLKEITETLRPADEITLRATAEVEGKQVVSDLPRISARAILPEDTLPPTIEVASPKEAKREEGIVRIPQDKRFLEIEGNVKDDRWDVVEVKCKEKSLKPDETGKFRLVVPIEKDSDEIVISAKDEWGNWGRFRFYVEREVPPDVVGPVFTLLEPPVKNGGVHKVEFKTVVQRDLKIRKKEEAEKKLTLKGLAMDESGVATVWINDEIVKLAKLEEDGKRSLLEREVIIKPGEEKWFKIVAQDIRGNKNKPFSFGIKGEEVIIEVTPAPSPVSPLVRLKYKKLYAFCVGFDCYPHFPEINLNYAVEDAQEMGKLFKQKFGFDAVHFLVYDQQDSREGKSPPDVTAIRRFLNQITDSKQIGPDDGVVVVYAGHGATVRLPTGGEAGYLLPPAINDPALFEKDKTGRAINPRPFNDQALAMDEVMKLARASPARHVLFLTDACYGGLAFVRGEMKLAADIEEALRRRARQIITAGGAEEQVVEHPDWGHGALFRALLDELRYCNKPLRATELFSRVRSGVPRLIELAFGAGTKRQFPQFAVLSGDAGGDFVFIPGKQ